MTRLTVPGIVVLVRRLALVGAALALVFAGSALAHGRPSQPRGRTAQPANGIHVSVSQPVKKKKTYNVTVHGFSRAEEKAFLFVDYNVCSMSFAVEHQRAQNEEVHYTVKGGFMKVSGWQSPVARTDHACVFLVNPKTGQVLAKGRVSYQVR